MRSIRVSKQAQISLPLRSPVSYLAYSSTLKLGVICTSETSGSIRTTRRYDPSLGHVIPMEVHRLPSIGLDLNWHEVELKLILRGCEIVCTYAMTLRSVCVYVVASNTAVRMLNATP
jgi:hypothetical protein